MMVTADNFELLKRMFHPDYWQPRKIGDTVPEYYGDKPIEEAMYDMWCMENGFAPVRMLSLAEMREIYGRTASAIDER